MTLTQKEKIDFMKKAAFEADHSTCNYRVGCVGVTPDRGEVLSPEAIHDTEFRRKNSVIYLKVWNETLSGEQFCQTCDSSGHRLCVRETENLKGRDFQRVCSIHAEVNLIAKCAKYRIPTHGMTIFVTNSPCYICAKSIIQAGISSVVYLEEHTDVSGLELLLANDISTEKLSHDEVFSSDLC